MLILIKTTVTIFVLLVIVSCLGIINPNLVGDRSCFIPYFNWKSVDKVLRVITTVLVSILFLVPVTLSFIVSSYAKTSQLYRMEGRTFNQRKLVPTNGSFQKVRTTSRFKT